MSAPDIPQDYTINSNMNGSLDLDLDNIRIKEIAAITLHSDSQLTSNSTVDMGLDDIRIKELPTIDLHLQASMKPTRMHFPVNMKFGLCTLGTELISFTICGESMVVVEDYVAHKKEECA
jgi:hypothetical protein